MDSPYLEREREGEREGGMERRGMGGGGRRGEVEEGEGGRFSGGEREVWKLRGE